MTDQPYSRSMPAINIDSSLIIDSSLRED